MKECDFNLSFVLDQCKCCADLKALVLVPKEQHPGLQWLLTDASNRWGKMRSVCIAEDIHAEHGESGNTLLPDWLQDSFGGGRIETHLRRVWSILHAPKTRHI